MQNTLVFFKYYIVGRNHEENSEHFMKKRLILDNKKRSVKLEYADLIDQKDEMIIQRILKKY